MRFLGPQRERAPILPSLCAPHSLGCAPAIIRSAFGALARLIQLNWIFAISEISKGVAIVSIGDMAIADDFGELVRMAAVTLPEMRGFSRAGAVGLAGAARSERGRGFAIGAPPAAPK